MFDKTYETLTLLYLKSNQHLTFFEKLSPKTIKQNYINKNIKQKVLFLKWDIKFVIEFKFVIANIIYSN